MRIQYEQLKNFFKREWKSNLRGTRKSLKWGMTRMLLFGWFFPMVIMILLMSMIIYVKSNDQIRRTVEQATEKAAEIFSIQLETSEIASKNASYLPTVRKAYYTYRLNGDRRNFQKTIRNFLKQQYGYDSNCKAAVLFFPEFPEEKFFIFNNSKSGTYQDINFFREYVKKDLFEGMEERDTKTELLNYENRIYMVRNLVDSKFQPYAILALELDTDSLMRGLYNIWGSEDITLYMNGEVFWKSPDSPEPVRYNEKIEQKLNRESIFFEHETDRDSYIYKRMRIYNGNMDIAVKLDNSIIYTETQTVHYVFLILLLFMIPLVCLILYFFHSHVTRPIEQMVEAFEEVRKEKYGIQIEEMNDSEEFCYMKESFNHMSTQLQNQFEKIYQEEILLRDARIMALQSQINPHFLNNTLEIINWEARLNENYKVSQMIEALSVMLEASMNRRAQPTNTIAEEMEYVDAYLYIIAQRLGDKFSCKKEIDESLFVYRIPRLIVQPIVENAVEHGIGNSRQGEISIRLFRKDENTLCIEVENNGTLSEADKEKIHRLLSEELDPLNEKHVSLGIRNVDRRLKMLYGEEYGLFITNNKNDHTVSTILVKIDERTEQ